MQGLPQLIRSLAELQVISSLQSTLQCRGTKQMLAKDKDKLGLFLFFFFDPGWEVPGGSNP